MAKIIDADVAITTVTSNLPLPNPNVPLQVFATVANTGSVDIVAVDVVIFLDLNSNLVLNSGEPSVLSTVIDLAVGTSCTETLSWLCWVPSGWQKEECS